MAEVRLTIEAQRADRREIRFNVNGPKPDFIIATERIADWSRAHVDERLLDLLDVAAAVFAADGLVTRGGLSRPALGSRWRRDLSFDVAVRDPEFWNADSVRSALVDAVGFLTNDRVDFAFRESRAPAPKQDYLKFNDKMNPPSAPSHVVLFSGGLDSLAGALETLARERGRVILVTHRSAPKIVSRQDELARALRQRHGDRVAYVPIRANMKGRKAPERTQRSRSFLFAAFGYVIARTVGADRLSFFENGIVSQNLPLSPQIIGTMATRTTHPLALRKFEALLSLIHGAPFAVRNEFDWLTKSQVVAKLGEHSAHDLIERAVSCNEVIARSVVHTHCGACSQCLDRRFGILAAGLSAYEPDSLYETPVLSGARASHRSRIAALEWTRHAIRLAKMEPMAFQEKFGGDIARIARGHPDMPGGEVLRRSLDLQRRHGVAVRRVLASEIAARSGDVVAGSLPATSLLRSFIADANRDPQLADVAPAPFDPNDASPPVAWPEDTANAGRLLIAMIGEGGKRRLEVRGLGIVGGAPAGPAFELKPQFLADRAAGLEAEDHRFVPAGKLAPRAGATKAAVAQNVRRCRAMLADFHEEVHGEPPNGPLLIQNRKNAGYRLDPHILLSEQPAE